MHQFNRAQLRATPWKNGGGVTCEIVSSPTGSGLDTFTWRVSIADVAMDGPFSVFDRVDRVIMLLDGNGFVLRDPSGREIQRIEVPFVPFAFSGEDAITSELVDGPSVDFNVMTRRGVACAEVSCVRADEELAASPAGVLLAVRGRWRVQRDTGAEQLRLDKDDGCWWDNEPLAWRVAPDEQDAVLLAVHVSPC